MSFFFFNDPATTEIYTLSLHDALPILQRFRGTGASPVIFLNSHGRGARATEHFTEHYSAAFSPPRAPRSRSEEHTSELQSQFHLVCRLLLEKKKKKKNTILSHKSYTPS